jgi:hypothetical protein
MLRNESQILSDYLVSILFMRLQSDRLTSSSCHSMARHSSTGGSLLCSLEG